MLLPLRDENPLTRLPIVTIALIGLNIASWVLVQGLGADYALAKSICEYGLLAGSVTGTAVLGTEIPMGDGLACVVDDAAAWPTLVTSMFLHGGWLHLLGNLWFLWIFGDNVEDAMSPLRYLGFYLLCGLAAAFAQIATDPTTLTPMVGASGAIGGVMGAYARLYPRARIECLLVIILYFTTVSIPAIYVLGLWFGLQLLGGLPELAQHGASGGVAFWAHIGGFIAGVALIGPLHEPRALARHRAGTTRRRARYRF